MTAISDAFAQSRKARGVAVETLYENLRKGQFLNLPQRIAILAQGSSGTVYSTDKFEVTTAGKLGSIIGFGSPGHLIAKQLLPVNGDGAGSIPITMYPIEDAGGALASTGDITPTLAQTAAASYIVRVNNIDSEPFVINLTGETVASVVTKMTDAINAVLDMPIIASDDATEVGTTSKWKGTSANDIHMEVIASAEVGNSFAITQHTGGTLNPDVDAALAQFGSTWYTLVINAMDIADTTTLDKIQEFNEGRWNPQVNKPFFAAVGNTITDVAAATVVSDARPLDYTNGQIPMPGSNELPFVVAARAVARISVLADNNPPHDYGSQTLTGLTPGVDGDQWTYIDGVDQTDFAFKHGSGTTIVKNGVANMGDTITFYKPEGEDPAGFSYVVDLMKNFNMIYNVDLTFNSPEWDGKPLVPDEDYVENPEAKKPLMAVVAIANILDSAGKAAIISNPAEAKKSIQVEIDGQNPKRLNMLYKYSLSGNTNILAITQKFSFFFG